METKEAIQHLKEIIKYQENDKGITSYDSESLFRLFDIVDKQASDSLTLRESQYKAQLENQTEMFKTIFVYGQSTLKAMLFINGGAAVAMLAFLSRYLSTGASDVNMHYFTFALLIFGAGVFLGTFTAGLSYITQYCYYHYENKSGLIFHILSVVTGISSLLGFCAGLYYSFLGFQNAFGA